MLGCNTRRRRRKEGGGVYSTSRNKPEGGEKEYKCRRERGTRVYSFVERIAKQTEDHEDDIVVAVGGRVAAGCRRGTEEAKLQAQVLPVIHSALHTVVCKVVYSCVKL